MYVTNKEKELVEGIHGLEAGEIIDVLDEFGHGHKRCQGIVCRRGARGIVMLESWICMMEEMGRGRLCIH